VSCLRLQGPHDCYIIDSELWIDLLDWAQDNGWEPQHPRELYDDSLHHLTVADDDAANLADALEFIAGDLVLHELSQVSDGFMRDLVDSLSKLSVFFQQGGFRIAPVPLAAVG
jgi:hypothetical protein